MPQKITTGFRALIDVAEREIETLSADEAIALHERPDVTFIDVRDIRELEREGRVPGAFHCPRGMLEFWIDPASPYHKPVFAEDKRFVFFCAGGWRWRWPHKLPGAWGSTRSRTSRAVSANGAKRTGRSKRSPKNQNSASAAAPIF